MKSQNFLLAKLSTNKVAQNIKSAAHIIGATFAFLIKKRDVSLGHYQGTKQQFSGISLELKYEIGRDKCVSQKGNYSKRIGKISYMLMIFSEID